MKSSPCRKLSFALLLSLLAACSQQPVEPGVVSHPRPGEAPADAQPPQPVADDLEQLLELARGSRDPRIAANAGLDAAAELLRRGEPARAGALLDALALDTLPPRERVRHAVLGARLELDTGDPHAAMARLQATVHDAAEVDVALQIELALVRSDVLAALGRPLDSARERTAIHPWLADETARHDNAVAIFAGLAAADMDSLQHEAAAAVREDWRGWIELAVLVRDLRRGPAAQLAELTRWEQRYTLIAALQSGTSLLPAIRERIRQPARVALLLPLSGDAAASGQAILHGYLAEHLRQLLAGEAVPPFAVIDTAAATGGFAAAYGAAIADGADFVIGPLLKEDLAAFGSAVPVSVPTLALNFSSTVPPVDGPLYSFGLDPLDEAAQLADVARQRGFSGIALFSDESDVALRQAQRFRERWLETAKGEIAGTLVLHDLNAFRRDFEHILLLEGSRQRAGALASLLGRELVTEVRHRQDLELLVMFANPVAARSLRSLTSFLYAGDLPLWAASQAHSGLVSQRDDRDLEGVRFLDAPWFGPAEAALRETVAGGVAAGSLQRLAALGVDAWRLQSRSGLLDWMQAPGLSGATGELSLDGRRQMHRHLAWYRFRRGLAIADSRRGALDAPLPVTASPSTEGEATWTTVPDEHPPVPQP